MNDTLCGGCARPIREAEEGVWVLHGSDECEAGGVHEPHREPDTGDLIEIFLIREKQGGLWLDRSSQVTWTHYIDQAEMFTVASEDFLPANSEYVRLVESPF